MSANIIALIILLIALYGYYSSIKISILEREIRKNKLNYNCFDCKEKFSVDELKCPKCGLITLYGARKKKFWVIIPIIITWGFMLVKFRNMGL
jgi:DNA-directed RNA polymerase subunit RPC12/RpoP